MNRREAMESLRRYAYAAAQNAATSSDPARFASLSRKLTVLGDTEIRKAAETSAQVACKPGCSYCCHRIVSATIPEILVIVGAIQAKGPDEVAKVVAALEAYVKNMEPRYTYHAMATPTPCPFLANDLCSIYEVRPFGCRMLNSTSAEVCKGWLGGPDADTSAVTSASVPDLAEPPGVIQYSIIGGFAAEGRPSGLYAVPDSVLALLKQPASEIDWSGPSTPLDRFKTYSEASRPTIALDGFAQKLFENPAYRRFTSLRIENVQAAKRELRSLGYHPANFLAALYLPETYDSVDHLEESWSRLGDELAELEEANLPPKESFDCVALFSAFFMAYSGKDVRPYMERLMRVIGDQYAAKAYPGLVAPMPDQRKPGRFRLGYASYQLKNFNGSRWALGWLRNHGPEIETFAFNLNQQEDEATQAWRRFADHFYPLAMPVAQAAEIIRQFDLDALILPDIGMDGVNLQMGALRLARRQFTAWGHPVTSGSKMIEGYLSSELMEPADGDEHYSERLYRLPGSGLCYPAIPKWSPPRSTAEELGLPSDGFLFCPQMHSKLIPSRDLLYKEIAERLGKPIIFVGPEAMRRRLAAVSPLLITRPRFEPTEYFRAVQLADTILDPPDWNGGNSTLEALSHKYAVVTMPGRFMRGRHSLAFHNLAGVSGLIAADEADYVALACDLERQEAAMEHIHPETLFDDLSTVRALDDILLEGHIQT